MKDLESERWNQGTKKANFYEQTLTEARNWHPKTPVVHPQDMPWEDSPQGKIKHVLNERMENIQTCLDLYMQEIPAGSKSGKHRHMAEEAIHILEGKGYDLHWDVDFELKDKYYWKVAKEPKRFDWEAGDTVLIPVNTVHQHFNADPSKPARFISAISCLYRRLDVNDLEQIEEAPK